MGPSFLLAIFSVYLARNFWGAEDGWNSRNTLAGRLLSFICLFAIFIFTHIIAFNACRRLGRWFGQDVGLDGAYKYDVIAFYGPLLLPAISLAFCLLIASHYSNVFV